MTKSIIDRTIGFPLGGVEETQVAFSTPLGAGLYSYARRENPTVASCERAIAKIEMAQLCLLTSSGMAAINVSLSIFNDPNDSRPWIFPADVYSGTKQYAIEVLHAQRGVNVKFADPAGQASTTINLISAIDRDPPAVVFVEPVSNPLLDVIDIPAVVEAAHRHGAMVIVDNTFATAYLFHPLDADVDIVMHSATKYLGGHNNILAGAICVNDANLYARILMHRNTIGSVLSPDDAGRLHTQLHTFSLRVAQQNSSAIRIAEYLDNHAGVAKVRYPGLASHHNYKLAQKMFGQRGFGAMITFDLARDEEGSSRFVDALSPNIPHIGSLGDVTTSFLNVQACFGEPYDASTIRLSVGIEPVEQIIASLDTALCDGSAG